MSVRAVVTRERIDPGAVLAAVGAPQDGAVVLFLGTVRDHNEGQAVRGLRYEAYESMANGVLQKIAEAAATRLGTERLTVVHRVGELEVGETSVAVAASSPHRAEAFDAVRWAMEEIKARLPVWKEERYVAGESRWLEGAVPPGSGERR